MREWRGQVPRTGDDRAGTAPSRTGIARREIPPQDPATEPRESEDSHPPRLRQTRGPRGQRARVLPRVESRGDRTGGIAVEALGTVRPNARTTTPPPRPDGHAHRARAFAHQEPGI